MVDNFTQQDILDSTTREVRKVIEEILKLEKDYEHIQDLESNKSKEKEISAKIIKIIERSVKL